MKKTPSYTYIISFLAQENVFKNIEDIIFNQVLKTGVNSAVAKLIVYSSLMKLKRNGTLVFINSVSGKRVWGFYRWLDDNNKPLMQHLPQNSSI